MKKINIIAVCLILFLGTFFQSCNDEGYKEGNSVVYISNTPFVNVDVYDISETFIYNLGIYRSGFGTTADVNVTVQTEAELEEYNAANDADYKLLPANCYEFLNTQVSFEGGIENTNTYIEIKFNLPALKNLYSAANGVEYALPVQIAGASIGINKEKASTIVVPTIKDPLFSMVFTGLQQYNFEIGKIPPTITVDIPIEVSFNNQWDVTCTLDNPESVLEDFNENNNKSFQMISNNYTLDKSVIMKAGTKRVVSKLVIETGKFDIGSHGLPIRLAEVSDSRFGVNPDASTFIVGVDIVVPAFDRTNWIAEVSSDRTDWGSNGPASMFDGNKDTFWHSTGGLGGGKTETIVIDMQKEYSIMQIDMMQRNSSYMDVKAGNFYTSSDGNNWTNVGTFAMEQNHNLQPFRVTTSVGRYIKIEITESYRDVAALAEIYVRGLEVE